MKVEEIVISVERKFNLGNYENVTYFESRKIRPESNDKLGEILDHTWNNLCSDIEQFMIRFNRHDKATDEKYRKEADKLIKESGADFAK